MAEKLGIILLKEVVSRAGHVVNAVSAFVNKGGLLALYPVIGEAQALVKEDWAGVKAEIQDLSAEEGAELAAVLKSELHLVNPAVQVKVSEAIDCLQEASVLVSEELALVVKAGLLLEKVKALVNPVPVPA